jgi:tRNA A37 threonylcarbamoyltransferase TsaD
VKREYAFALASELAFVPTEHCLAHLLILEATTQMRVHEPLELQERSEIDQLAGE